MTDTIDHNKLLSTGDRLKDIITETQAKFSRAIYTLNCESAAEQVIIEANLDIARYENILRQCCRALGVNMD